MYHHNSRRNKINFPAMCVCDVIWVWPDKFIISDNKHLCRGHYVSLFSMHANIQHRIEQKQCFQDKKDVVCCVFCFFFFFAMLSVTKCLYAFLLLGVAAPQVVVVVVASPVLRSPFKVSLTKFGHDPTSFLASGKVKQTGYNHGSGKHTLAHPPKTNHSYCSLIYY